MINPMIKAIFVTGATGNVGVEVVQLLRAAGAPVIAGLRRPAERGPLPPDVPTVRFDFLEPATYAPALAGVDQLFLLRPPAIADVKRQLNPVVDAASAAGVRRIVFLSLLGAERLPWVPHRTVERHIEGSGLDYTFLRASFFMQNLSTTHAPEIRELNEILVPAGRGKTSFVDVRDLAAVAVKALTEATPPRRAYDLTGSEALDYGEVAAILSAVIGRPICYRRPSIWRFVRRMRQRGFALPMIVVMVGIYTTARLGLAGAVTADLARLLGRPPITMRQFIEESRAIWL
jgi:uncharacterized protein YbjT (DUF2867 family)